MTEKSNNEEPRIVGKKATVKVAVLMEYTVDVEMPPSADAGEHADLELWARRQYDEYDEKDVIHSEVLDEEPIWSNEREEEAYPTHA